MAAQLNRTFDRKVSFDERSRNYDIRGAVASKPLRSYTWSCKAFLDQGEEGACVGFGWSHFLAARPKPEPGITNTTAQQLYKLAQTLDEWPGSDYDGTSVIAGAKAVQSLRDIKEYRWAFNTTDVLLTVGHVSPVVLGINWYEGMDLPDKSGIIRVTGSVRGGHCILLNGINVKSGLVRVHNSWGNDWAYKGEAFLTFDDLDKLLKDDGEACIPLTKELQ